MSKNDFDGKLGENYSDSLIGFPHYFQIQDAFMKKILELTKESDGKLEILEAGCGSGVTTARLVFLRPDCQVVSVDNSRQMIIEQAQRTLQLLTDRVQFIYKDILEFNPQEKFDIFASGFMMHNFIPKQRVKMIQLAYQWIEEGGVFALMDKIACDEETLHQKNYQQQIKYFKALIRSERKDLYSKWIEHYRRDEEIKFTESKLLELLKGVGFKNIEIHSRFCMDLIVTAQK